MYSYVSGMYQYQESDEGVNFQVIMENKSKRKNE